tara:strand:- start:125 stop:2122 length:1998 start_codon:yes stop_codon:yes gene_type:complete
MNPKVIKEKDNSQNKYRVEIDGLRAVAVFAVILNHFDKQLLPNGYLGVDLFFVISGYVITSSLVNNKEKEFTKFIINFYERRLRRLIPLLVFFTIIVGTLTVFLNTSPGVSINTGFFGLFGVSNIYLFSQSTDYFAQSTDLNPFTHTWSLAVEEQFYLIYPFLLWLCGYCQGSKNGSKKVFLTLLFLSIASLIGFIYMYQFNQPAAYFLMPFRFWEISFGSIIFLLVNKKNKLLNLLKNIPSEFLFILILFIFKSPNNTPVFSTILIVILSGIILLTLRPDNFLFKILTNSKIVYLGTLSYSLYLWHWAIFSLSRWTFDVTIWTLPFQFALILFLSIATNKFIELPFRSNKFNFSKFITFLFTLGSVFLTSIFLLLFKFPLKNSVTKINNFINPPKYRISNKNFIVEQYCHFPTNNEKALQQCLMPPKNKFKNLFLIGDSHMSNHIPSAEAAIKKLGNMNLNFLIDRGFINSLLGDESCSKYKFCVDKSWEKHKNFFKANLKSNDFVFFSWARDRTKKNQFSSFPRETSKVKMKILKKKLIELNEIILSKNAKLILIDDIPKVCEENINYDFTILKKGEIDKCKVKKSVSLEDRSSLSDLYKFLSGNFSNISYLDFHDDLCFDDYCLPVNNSGSILYADNSPHIHTTNRIVLEQNWLNFFKKFSF